ncbi:glycosyltransferase family 2 protein [Thalassotalea sp. LPB0316]|uniref:glycosyltransferase family 2 protein n=1 Tax=Thalassotalea sp. LPB0316 TaxID=2769490 RepID=UPI001867FFB7|nr:glycosyltransferase family 2 protein [Thalassotalea sp. LPB0316]QOL26501.1 glycosyltransferase family 2 protein [Thalassotalea sp. LPB0316]
MVIAFIVTLSLLVYSYFIYPLILKLIAKEQKLSLETKAPLPSVEVIVAAYNEESCIKERLENLLAQDYQGSLRVLVASDGSQDKTGEIIESFDDPRIQAYNFEVNRGKISVLNDLVSKATADLLVFTDANTHFESNAITVLAQSITGNVGAVCGELHLETDDGNQNLDGFYWKYEQFLKKSESSLGSLLGANGAIYAIKRELYQELPADTIVDDFCIVMNVKKQGFDVVYNDQAIAREEVAPSLSEEYGRRVRIGTGNYKAFFANLWALSPLQGTLSWCYWSHKVIRWFGPHLLLILFLTNLALIEQPIFQALFYCQIIFYVLAVWGQKQAKKNKEVHKLVKIISFFVSMNVALGQGFIKFCQGNSSGGWKRTARTGENS